MTRQQLEDLFGLLVGKKFITDIIDVTGTFSDEPYFPYYISKMHPDLAFYNRNGWLFTPTGTSLHSKKVALAKCLSETIEKTSQFYFSLKNISFSSTKDTKANHLDLQNFQTNYSNQNNSFITQDTVIGWVKGHNLTENIPGYMPAQLIHPNYHQFMFYEKNLDEPLLMPVLQTFQGSAAGLDQYSTILRAIYEIIERDARSLLLALKGRCKVLNPNHFHSHKLNTIVNLLERYGFEIYFFNILNDLQIPVIMTVLIDLSAKGPLINTGFSSSLKKETAAISSIEDTFYQRYFHRIEMLKKNISVEYTHKYNAQVFAHMFKSKSFLHKDVYQRLKYLFNNSLEEYKGSITNEFIPSSCDAKSELKQVIKKLQQKGFDIWVKLIDKYPLNEENLHIYKAIIPGLQPTLRNSPLSNYNQSRLRNARSYYQHSNYYVR